MVNFGQLTKLWSKKFDQTLKFYSKPRFWLYSKFWSQLNTLFFCNNGNFYKQNTGINFVIALTLR